jgi:hypothetical protein
MPRWGATEQEDGFPFARGGSVTRPHDPADHGSTESAEEVIFQVSHKVFLRIIKSPGGRKAYLFPTPGVV